MHHKSCIIEDITEYMIVEIKYGFGIDNMNK